MAYNRQDISTTLNINVSYSFNIIGNTLVKTKYLKKLHNATENTNSKRKNYFYTAKNSK